MFIDSCISRLARLASLASLLLVAACIAEPPPSPAPSPSNRSDAPSAAVVESMPVALVAADLAEPTGTINLGTTPSSATPVAGSDAIGCLPGSQSEIETNDTEATATVAQPGILCGKVGGDEDIVDVIKLVATRGLSWKLPEGALVQVTKIVRGPEVFLAIRSSSKDASPYAITLAID